MTLHARPRANKRMIYHYFGSKDGLYLAVLERVYEGLARRRAHAAISITCSPKLAIRRLIEFNFDYCRAHPELISLINNENLHRARHLHRSRRFATCTARSCGLIGDILKRGVAKGVFRRGLDPVDVYITDRRASAISTSRTTGRCRRSSARTSATACGLRARKRHNVDMMLHAFGRSGPLALTAGACCNFVQDVTSLVT